MMKFKGKWFERSEEFRTFVENAIVAFIEVFQLMSKEDSISKDFEVFLMEHNIESVSQDIGLVECANQAVVTIAKRMLKKLKSLINHFEQK